MDSIKLFDTELNTYVHFSDDFPFEEIPQTGKGTIFFSSPDGKVNFMANIENIESFDFKRVDNLAFDTPTLEVYKKRIKLFVGKSE